MPISHNFTDTDSLKMLILADPDKSAHASQVSGTDYFNPLRTQFFIGIRYII